MLDLCIKPHQLRYKQDFLLSLTVLSHLDARVLLPTQIEMVTGEAGGRTDVIQLGGINKVCSKNVVPPSVN